MIVYNSLMAYKYYHVLNDRYKNLEQYTPKLLKILNEIHEPFMLFFDRTGILPNVLKLSYPQPLPDVSDFTGKSFREISEERIIELIEQDKPIHIWWSGGIDSTCVLSLFFQKSEYRKCFKVRLNHASIIESGTIFEKYIRKNCDWELHTLNDISIDNNVLNVSGNMGNHIMGQGPGMGQGPEQDRIFEKLNDDWKKYINKHGRMTETILEYIKPVMEIYPKKIVTFFDYMNFYSMMFKWHQDYYHPMIFGLKDEAFYKKDEFQKWSVCTNELKYKDNIYKLPMKDIIKDVFPDDNYYYNRTTRSSVLFTKKLDWVFLFDNLKLIMTKEAFR